MPNVLQLTGTLPFFKLDLPACVSDLFSTLFITSTCPLENIQVFRAYDMKFSCMSGMSELNPYAKSLHEL